MGAEAAIFPLAVFGALVVVGAAVVVWMAKRRVVRCVAGALLFAFALLAALEFQTSHPLSRNAISVLMSIGFLSLLALPVIAVVMVLRFPFTQLRSPVPQDARKQTESFLQ